jgi:dienelactone hydrolase
MLIRSLLLAALLLPAPHDDGTDVDAAPLTDPTLVESIIDLGLNDSRVMEHLDVLVNDIGPRLTSSSNLTQACQWAAETFRSYGLETRLEEWTEMPLGFDRGVQLGAMVAPSHEQLSFLSYAWTRGTNGALRAPAVLGPGTVEELETMADSLVGAWILQTRETRRDRELRDALRTFADERGCAGFISVSSDSGLLLMSGSMPDSMDDIPTAPQISLLAEQFNAITERLALGEMVELEFDIENIFLPGPVSQLNVIADLVGSEWPDEYVIVGGHIDSWDGATGTTDNGTGCATTIEAARLLVESGARPRRTIRFMLWSGEEQGLLGSRGWVSDNPDELDKISAVLVHDGGTNYLAGISVTPPMKDQFDRALAPLLAFTEQEGSLPFTLREVPGLQPSGGSDHVSFLREGVPGFFWRQAGDADYNYTHHTQHDTYDSAIEPYQKHSSVVAALSALGLANLPAMLNRDHMIVASRRLGVWLDDDGRTVSRVANGMQAATRGMEDGDRLYSVNGEEIGEGSLSTLLNTGEARKLLVWDRGGDDPVRHQAVFAWDHGDVSHAPEAVAITTEDGLHIAADYYMGAEHGAAAGSAVVLLHMYGSDRYAWEPMRAPLYEQGIATLAIDMRGHGESLDEQGELAERVRQGDPALFGAMHGDVAAAVAWLEGRGYAAERIGLMGASVGCSVAIRAALADERLAGVVALSPGTDYLGVDTLGDLQGWDERPLMLVSSREEAERGAAPLERAVRARDRWLTPALVLLEETDIHGTRMFGVVADVEVRLAGWWAARLR